MEKKILIVSTSETFSVRGLEMKLKGLSVETVFSEPRLKSLEEKCKDTILIILYTNEDVHEDAQALVYLKDHCVENDIGVIVIGAKEEYETVQNFIPERFIAGFFERPLEMDRLLDEVERILSEKIDKEKRKNILIVDDDVSYLGMVMEWLQDTYRVAVANSGMQAITYLVKNHVDLILLDYEMPVNSGPQVLEMIRSEADTADTPVMFLTGKSDRGSIMKVLALKPADYLLKSIDKAGLLKKLDDYFLSESVKKI